MKWAAAVIRSRSGRYVARSIATVNQAGVLGFTWWGTHEMLMAALAVAAAFRAGFTESPVEGDREGLLRYLGLAVVLEALMQYLHATFPH